MCVQRSPGGLPVPEGDEEEERETQLVPLLLPPFLEVLCLFGFIDHGHASTVVAVLFQDSLAPKWPLAQWSSCLQMAYSVQCPTLAV